MSESSITSTSKNTEMTFDPEEFKIVGIDESESEKIYRPSITYWQDVWRRFKANKVALFAAILFISIAVLTIIGPSLSGYDYRYMDKNAILLPPCKEHWFGTDRMGRDTFTRVCVGGRISIVIGVVCTFFMAVIGSIYGGIAGYCGGKVDFIMMRIAEILSSMPYLIVVILLSLIMGRSMFSLVVAMTAFSWIGTSRLVRGQVLQLKESEYVLSAKALGASSREVIFKHMLPNSFGILMVDITLSVPGFIFSEAFLSYIGLGVKPPQTSWGALASEAQEELMFYPYLLFFPCLFISLVMLSFNLLGDGLNDAMDPQLRQ